MKIDDVILEASVQDVLEELRKEFKDSGIQYFAQIKENGDNIQTNCPFHKGGQERKPSFGIHKDTGKCHCFTCGWGGNLFQLVGDMYNLDKAGDGGKRWLLKRFSATEIEQRKVPKFNLTRKKLQANPVDEVTEEELNQYRYYHPYMFERKLSRRIISIFDVGYDKNTDCLTFPVYDTQNRCVFVARRSVKVKYFHYPKTAKKPIYALNRCIQKKVKKVYIVESIFNCLTLWQLGIPAVALLGLGSETQIQELIRSPIRHYVLALDPDERGQKAQVALRKRLSARKAVTILQYKDPNKDINDLFEDVLLLKEVP